LRTSSRPDYSLLKIHPADIWIAFRKEIQGTDFSRREYFVAWLSSDKRNQVAQ